MAKFADIHSVTVGDFKVTYLPDGGGLINPTAMYPTSTETGWGSYSDFLDEGGRIVVSIGGFLIETADQKIIMDTGFGPMTVAFPGFGPFMGGKFLESLAQTGVAREDVTAVFYTHLHLDHVGWTSIEGADGTRELTFPNARHLCTETEWDYWQNDETGLGPNPETVLQPLKNVIQFITDGDELAPSLSVVSTPGHTPGHLSLRIVAGDQQLYLIADLLHSEVQFYEADWYVAFDIDPALGRQSREGIYKTLAQPNTMVADGHFANQVFGHLTHENGKWCWNPLAT